MEKLTKQEAIQKHRDMWNWIASEIKETEEVQDIGALKINYCIALNIRVSSYCFLCEYCDQNDWKFCNTTCLLKWRNGKSCINSEFIECCESETWEKQYELALKIANLEERKIEDESI